MFTILSCAYVFLLPVSSLSALPPPLASIQIHLSFTEKHHFCKLSHVPYTKFRKQVRTSLTYWSPSIMLVKLLHLHQTPMLKIHPLVPLKPGSSSPDIYTWMQSWMQSLLCAQGH